MNKNNFEHQERVNKTLWLACDILRGRIGIDLCRDFIFTLLFLKVISDVWQDHRELYQQKYGEAPDLVDEMMQHERFVLPGRASFNSLWARRHEPGNGERLDQALYAIEEANGLKLKGIGASVFQGIRFNSDALGEEKQKNTLLRHLLEEFAKPELNLKPSHLGDKDIVSGACEYLLHRFASSQRQKCEEFYTPPEVSDLIIELLDPQPGESICDPAAGCGSLLIKFGRKVVANHSSKSYELFGQEVNGAAWSLAKLNLFLQGEDNHRIEWGDTLRNPMLLDKNGDLMQFDILVANPPFMLEKWGRDEAQNDRLGRFHRGVPPKNKGAFAFILHMIESLKPDTGRMAVVMPHGVLFRGYSEGNIRKQLIEENLLDAVIGLPEKLFYGTAIAAVILVFSNDKFDDSVMFIDASREFASGKKQNRLSREFVQNIVGTYRAGKDVPKYAYVASHKEIKANDYNLSISRYVDIPKEAGEADLMVVRAERQRLKAELSNLEMDMVKYIKELGYE